MVKLFEKFQHNLQRFPLIMCVHDKTYLRKHTVKSRIPGLIDIRKHFIWEGYILRAHIRGGAYTRRAFCVSILIKRLYLLLYIDIIGKKVFL